MDLKSRYVRRPSVVLLHSGEGAERDRKFLVKPARLPLPTFPPRFKLEAERSGWKGFSFGKRQGWDLLNPEVQVTSRSHA